MEADLFLSEKEDFSKLTAPFHCMDDRC